MGVLTLITMMASNTVINWIHSKTPPAIALLVNVTIISTFVSVLQLFVQAFLPALGSDLSIYLPLIVINCLILCVLPCPPIHALQRALGFCVALLIMGALRELLGVGTLLGFTIFPDYYPMLIMILPSGAFLLMGLMVAILTWTKSQHHE